MPSPDLDFRDRPRLFAKLEARRYDLIVIGAGITGAGVARDAAGRGLSVALIEGRDIASGTSSRSSKMIHGGLRYLAQGELGLVREAATERAILRSIAPHLARPCPFVLPAGSWAGLTKFRAAMWAFEKLSKIPDSSRHEVWSAEELAQHEPLAAHERMVGAVVYPEFLTHDARLTLANVRSARAAGADVLTRAEVTTILREGERAVGVICRGGLSGEELEATVHGRVIVNAGGPWVDEVLAMDTAAGREDASAQLHSQSAARVQVTRGIHVVLPHARLPLSRMVLMNSVDRRPVFAVPYGDVTYLGTTDTFYPRQDYWPTIERQDVDYLFAAAQRSLCTEPLRTAEVVAMWAGIRPLVSQAGKKPSEISRREEIWTSRSGILTIAGGKLTAYRAMAERIVDRVVDRADTKAGRCMTRDAPLVGGDHSEASLRAELSSASPGANRRLIDRLIRLYGSEARRLVEAGGDVAAEAAHAVRCEGALHLEDYWVRRSARAWLTRDAGLGTLELAADSMAQQLGWDAQQRSQQIADCARLHGASLACIQDNNTVGPEGSRVPEGTPPC